MTNVKRAVLTELREAIREAGVKRNTPRLYTAVMAFDAALRQPTPDAMPMDTALISAYKQGFADGAEEQRCCFADETPHKDCINEGFQNWLANNPSIRAALEARGLEIRSKNDD